MKFGWKNLEISHMTCLGIKGLNFQFAIFPGFLQAWILFPKSQGLFQDFPRRANPVLKSLIS